MWRQGSRTQKSLGRILRIGAAVFPGVPLAVFSFCSALVGLFFDVVAYAVLWTLQLILRLGLLLDQAYANSRDQVLPNFLKRYPAERFWRGIERACLPFRLRSWIFPTEIQSSASDQGTLQSYTKEIRNQVILVICGPPCSGKSYLMGLLKSYWNDIIFLEMDAIREEILRGRLHDKPTRSASYRVMHYLATKELKKGKSVALNATYMPEEQRAEVASIALRLRVPLYVVQCVCMPDEAMKRFVGRESGHAATDLTAERVKKLSEQYEQFDGALLINTDTTLIPDQISALNSYLRKADGRFKGFPGADPIQWARHSYASRSLFPESKKQSSQTPAKLSESSVRLAKHRLFRYAVVWVALMVVTVLGVLPFIYKIVARFHAEYLVPNSPLGLPSAITKAFVNTLRDLWTRIPQHGLADWAEWATFCLALVALGSVVFEIMRGMKGRFEEARRIKRTGDCARYDSVPESDPPSDKELFHAYRWRIVPQLRKRLRIPNVPIFFAVRPFPNRSFSVLAHAAHNQDFTLPEEAASLGLDWNGFASWRQKRTRGEYALTYSHEYGLRCLGIEELTNTGSETTRNLNVVKCPYDEYASRELAVNYCDSGTLPDMRRLFEGEAWDAGDLDLLNISESAKRYSMRVSVTGLVLTEDDFFVLQRRSAVVGHGLGSLAASVNGAADYYADTCETSGELWPMLGRMYAVLPYSFHGVLSDLELGGPRKWDLAKTALREIKEEIGLEEDVFVHSDGEKNCVPPFKRPFLAAAYNLRHGRDLNFYCCLRTHLKAKEISAERSNARDKWEVEHLVFLPRDKVTVRAIRSGELEQVIPKRARHLLGALYSWAVYANAIRKPR